MARKKKRGRPQDQYGRKAKGEGFAARSVYKLDELQSRLSLVRTGESVLDLGAAPGSWSERLLELVGETGRVISVDLSAIAKVERAGRTATVIQGDFTEESVVEQLIAVGPFDVVVSDAAPSTTGNRTVDTARSAGLVESALALCHSLLRPGGNAALKIFQGGDEQTLLADMRSNFDTVKQLKPKASRDESFETFLVGLGFRGGGPNIDGAGSGGTAATGSDAEG
ncbi:MAG: RlmE family RNA methyltransferase [Spirochaetales bacterium]